MRLGAQVIEGDKVIENETQAARLYRELAEAQFANNLTTDECQEEWLRTWRRLALEHADELVGKGEVEIAAIIGGLAVDDPEYRASLARRQEANRLWLAKQAEVAQAKADGSIYS